MARPGRRFVDLLREPGVDHQILELRISVVGILNSLQQPGADDAPPLPDLGDRGHVQLVVQILGSNAKQFHTLGIAGDATENRGIHQWSHGICR